MCFHVFASHQGPFSMMWNRGSKGYTGAIKASKVRDTCESACTHTNVRPILGKQQTSIYMKKKEENWSLFCLMSLTYLWHISTVIISYFLKLYVVLSHTVTRWIKYGQSPAHRKPPGSTTSGSLFGAWLLSSPATAAGAQSLFAELLDGQWWSCNWHDILSAPNLYSVHITQCLLCLINLSRVFGVTTKILSITNH